MFHCGGSDYLTIEDSWIRDNIAGYPGGGLVVRRSGLVLRNTELESNSGSGGGGLYLLYGQDFSNEIADNTFLTNTAAHLGGGFYCDTGTLADFSGNTFQENVAGDYGGGFLDACSGEREQNMSLNTWIDNLPDDYYP